MNTITKPTGRKAGIYKITNIKNGKCYIGQSVNLDSRINDHKRGLENNQHHNKYLQRSFNKYGKRNFVIEVLEECDIEELDEKETFWISFFDSTNHEYGYNFESGGHEGKKMHEKTKRKLSVMRLGKGNPMFGKKLPPERIKQIRETNRGTNNMLTEKEVKIIKESLLDGKSQNELAEEFGVDYTTINKIYKCVNWKWVRPELNDALIEHAEEQRRKRNSEIIRLHKRGLSQTAIADTLNCGTSTVYKLVGARASYKSKRRRERIMAGARKDFSKGLKTEEIAKKYRIDITTCRRYIEEVRREREQELHNKILNMHKEGMLVKDIADELGMHRTTITEHIKGRTKAKKRKQVPYTKELGKKVMELVDEGLSQREISRRLEISRYLVKKAIKMNKEEVS